MPTSVNRRRVELPAALFARLEERARRDGQTIAGLVAALLASALDASVGGEQGERGGDQEVRALLMQALHYDKLHQRELQFVGQRLDLALRVLVAGQPAAEGDPGDALAEYRVAEPLPQATTLAQAGEPRPIQSRTLWQRPQESPKREATEDREE
jgi:hypothetical protein